MNSKRSNAHRLKRSERLLPGSVAPRNRKHKKALNKQGEVNTRKQFGKYYNVKKHKPRKHRTFPFLAWDF